MPVGSREVGQLRLAQHQLQVAALRDVHAVGQRRRQVGEQRLHLRLGLEVLLAREALARAAGWPASRPRRCRRAPRAPRSRRAARNCTGCVATTGSCSARGQRHRARARAPRCSAGRRAAARCRSAPENSAASRCASARARAVVAGQQRLPTAPLSAPDSAISPPPSSSSQSHLTQACVRCALLRPGARQQFAQVEVTVCVLHQQQQPAGLLVAAPSRLHPDVDADDRLDARAAARLVELDRAEQVVQVGDGQRHLAVGARRRRHRRCAACRRRRNIRCGCAGGRRTWVIVGSALRTIQRMSCMPEAARARPR